MSAEPRSLTYREGLNAAMAEELRRDETVLLLGEDIADPFGGSYKTTRGLSDEFGAERVRNTPISEEAIVGAALGCALTGLRPVAEVMYVDFMTLCMDMVVNQAAQIRYMSGGQVRVPMVVRTQGGAGRSSAAQHAKSLEAWFCHVPGLKVVMPSTPRDALGLLKASIRDDNPVIFLEHKLLLLDPYAETVPDGDHVVPLGVADVKRMGTDVTVIATSRMVRLALAVADELAESGVSVEVVDPRTLVPLDEEAILASVRKTNRAVVVHEGFERNGFGAEVAALIGNRAFDDLDAPVERVAGANAPIPFSPVLENAVIPNEARIRAGIEKVLGGL
ncbi:MAG TPA: alpha-ketoacid dehydrogenase subunit beta [Gaiellaceae bacterium]|nr:alpha-ketoacid dehydrogenase subunit beta [Gaiellaceae bacterium]